MNKVSFSWNLIVKCNYRCPYCWYYGRWHQENRRNFLSVKELVTRWENIYKKYGEAHIDILGGEPFLYPDFAVLIKELSGMHTINITTNLSCSIDDFMKDISPQRVGICSTFHPAFAEFNVFLEKALILKEHKFGDRIAYLAYPPQIKQAVYYNDSFRKAGLAFSLMSFWGKYNGKDYPQSYTQEEKEMMRPFLGDRSGEKFQITPKRVKGLLCRAGQTYAAIYFDGTAFRCGGEQVNGSKSAIGNFFNGDFKLLEKPSPCTYDSCPCNEWASLAIQDSGEVLKDNFNLGIAMDGDKALTIPKQEQKEEELPLQLPLRENIPKIYWNWEITYSCNFQCSYCQFWRKKTKNYLYDIRVWREKWNTVFNRYGCCHIRYSGGEPTIYPGFFELMAALADMHTIDVTTNLSFDINILVKKVNPAAVVISPSFHPEFIDINSFLKKISILRKNGFFINGVAYVSYPPLLAGISQVMRAVERENIEFKIIPFNGKFSGRQYPQEYSDEEKAFLRRAAEASLSRNLNLQWLNWHTKKDESADAVAVTQPRFSLCRMGELYAKIAPDGTITRCCSPYSSVLGNILEDDFKILEEPQPCVIKKCPCFKAMVIGREQDWLPHWGSPKHPKYSLSGKIN